jgi:hypothetical protein
MNFPGKQRLRRYAKRAGLCTCLLILVAWAVSLWSYSQIAIGERWFVASTHRGLTVALFEPTYPLRPLGPHFEWQQWQGIRFEAPELVYYTGATCLLVPFWLLFLIAALPTALLFYLNRRKIPPGHCSGCEYDLRGIESGICPECGKVNPSIHAQAAREDGNAKVEESTIR